MMPSADLVRSLLNYDPETGVFSWRVARGAGVKPGDIAGSITRGYRYIHILKRAYLAHRLAFVVMTGEWPPAEVDHVNCERDDNRWLNLRAATRSDNLANSRVRRTGLKGVSTVGDRWRAEIRRFGVRRHLGCFATEQEAHAAYMTAASTMHKEFARAA